MPLKEAIGAFLRDYGLRERFLQTMVQTRWPEIMGKMVAKHTTDVYVKNRTLTVFIDSAPLRHELTAGKGNIVQLVNDAIGESVIDQVFIR